MNKNDYSISTVRAINTFDIFNSVLNKNKGNKISPRVVSKLVRNAKTLQPIKEDFFETQRQAVKSYAELDEDGELQFEDGDVVYKSEEDKKEFKEEMDELKLEERDLELFPISYDEVDGLLTVQEVLTVDFLLVE